MRKERLELSQVTPLEPKSSASTNSATFALYYVCFQPCRADYITKSLFYPHHGAPAQPALQQLGEDLRQIGERHRMRHLRQQFRMKISRQPLPDYAA